MLPLDECERIARHANDRTYTMGVALAPCSLPQTRKHNFEIGPGEMEIGMGIHGEPGMRREPLKTADAVVDEIIERIFTEMPPKRGDKVAVLVNSLGSTPLDGALHHEPARTPAPRRKGNRASMRPGSGTIAPRWRWPARRSR